MRSSAHLCKLGAIMKILPVGRILCFLFLLSALPRLATAAIVSEEVTEPFPGIRILERISDAPPMRIYAAYISVGAPSHYIDATAPTRQPRTVENWARENDALLAVNGDFFRYTDRIPHLYGDAVGGGKRWPEEQTGRGQQYENQWFHGRYGWFAFGGDGVTFTHSRQTKQNQAVSEGWKPKEVTSEIPPNTRALVSGFSQLVIEGEPAACEDPTAAACFPDRKDLRERHPRTAVGLTRDRRNLILVVVDGRSEKSVGMFGTELAALLKHLGAWNAINLDGGGSSQMYVKGRGTINAPEVTERRKVLNHLGVFPKK